ncbi:MAG: hypothetical protein KOO60_07615 [Gemmatimonadales bacterium]|nr:hypothetical protein [Gemmatimonadales bacterium]
MSVVPILFEDHLVSSFRPMAWSVPLFEIRCGLFNTRERVELSLAGPGMGSPEGTLIGGFLSRSLFAELHTSPNWTADPVVIKRDLLARDNRILLLNGRIAARYDILERFLGAEQTCPDFAIFDGQGLIGALLSSDKAAKVIEAWVAWEQDADKSGAWKWSGISPGPWKLPGVVAGSEYIDLGKGFSLWDGDTALEGDLRNWVAGSRPLTYEWIWDIVPGTPSAIEEDLAAVVGVSGWRRFPFGIFPEPSSVGPAWAGTVELFPGKVPERVHVTDPSRFWTGSGVRIGPALAVDTQSGPVILDRGVVVQPHVYLEGPLYVGPGSVIKAGARLYGESSFGIENRLAGEIGESTFSDFANKQHAGFIGHAVLGAWINLGAMTTCSDLKNNYGNIRVDLGEGPVETGQRFIGLMMGDHAKTAIGTLFNTGTSVGFASNIFGGGMPPKLVGNFSWGGEAESPLYAVDKALETAATVMTRRGCLLTGSHRELFSALAE